MTLRRFTPCGARHTDGHDCSGELGHEPASDGDHWATERAPGGRIVGPISWSGDVVSIPVPIAVE